MSFVLDVITNMSSWAISVPHLYSAKNWGDDIQKAAIDLIINFPFNHYPECFIRQVNKLFTVSHP